MFEYYWPAKWIHVGAVLASGTLFLLRGLGVQARHQWPMHPAARYLSYSIDTVLLGAALTLAALLPQGAFSNGWLAAKLLLLAGYVILGSFALKRARTPRMRLTCYIAALLSFAFMVSIAYAHDPLGILRRLLR